MGFCQYRIIFHETEARKMIHLPDSQKFLKFTETAHKKDLVMLE